MTLSQATNSLVAYEGLPSNEVCSIMRHIVAKNSTEKYNLKNVKLLLWLYNEEDLREEVLWDSFMDRLNEASSSLRDMRKVYKEALHVVEKGANNCPIMLQKLSFNIFLHYLATRRNRKNKYLSRQSYRSVRSALMHLYRTSGETRYNLFKII